MKDHAAEHEGPGEVAARDLRERFNYHRPPHYGVVDAHARIRSACFGAAMVVVEKVPAGRERAIALTKLEEAMMWANAGIARNHDQVPEMSEPPADGDRT